MRNFRNGLFQTTLTLVAAFGISESASCSNAMYGVSQTGNLILIKTPWGSSIYLAPVGFDSMSNYSFEIPLSEFRAGMTRGQAPTGPGDESARAGGAGALGDEATLISEANRRYNEGDFQKSLQFVDEVSRRNPKNVRAWIMKGSLMHVLGHKDLARQAWEKALALDPGNTQIQNIMKEQK